jgi:hypothetical protein
MLAYMTLQEKLTLPLIAIGALLSMALLWVDIKFIYAQEAEYVFRKTPAFIKMERDIAEIKELLTHDKN